MLAGHQRRAVDQRRPDLRFPFPERFAERLRGRTVISLGRRAKYLMADLSGGDILVMHLGMTGRFIVEEPGGALWRGAANEVKLLLEQRLGMAKK